MLRYCLSNNTGNRFQDNMFLWWLQFVILITVVLKNKIRYFTNVSYNGYNATQQKWDSNTSYRKQNDIFICWMYYLKNNNLITSDSHTFGL
jgi:hypothetical protein